jgi:hypothetical protein
MAIFGTLYATALHRRDAMTCKSCTSENGLKFSAEINVHFGGWEGLKKPAVLVFPKLLVCMDCGFTEFFTPERELAALASGSVTTKPHDGGMGIELEQSGVQDYA